jgi:hypothetical protein
MAISPGSAKTETFSCRTSIFGASSIHISCPDTRAWRKVLLKGNALIKAAAVNGAASLYILKRMLWLLWVFKKKLAI